MPETQGRYDLKEECVFWLAILRDHAEFMYAAFPSSEKADAKEAQYYMGVFTDLHKRAASGDGDKVTAEIQRRVDDFRKFQEDVLHRQLTCSVAFNLPPLILQETIDEAREFLLVLQGLVPEKDPVLQDMHEHLMWLWNFTAHADAVGLLVDPVERTVLTRAQEFRKLFMALFYKAYSYRKMIKTRPDCLTNLIYFNREAAAASKEFMDYLADLKGEVEQCRVLGILPPLLLDHMMREARYYLGKIRSDCQKDPVWSDRSDAGAATWSVPIKKRRLWPAKGR